MEINPNTKKKEQVYVIDEETGKKVPAYVKLDYPIVKNYVVFNASQVEGIEKEELKNITKLSQNKSLSR